MLFKVEVTLHPDNKGVLPFGARREIVRRYDQLEQCGDDGMKMVEQLRETEYLVFDDVAVPFTGKLFLTYPCLDYWEVPRPISDEDEETQRKAEATFENGLLQEWDDYPA